jgi:hypothetical protein
MDEKEVNRHLYQKGKEKEIKIMKKFITYDAQKSPSNIQLKSKIWKKTMNKRYVKDGLPYRGKKHICCYRCHEYGRRNEILKEKEQERVRGNLRKINLQDLEDDADAFEREIIVNEREYQEFEDLLSDNSV